jgi:hypothetical protein
VWGLTGSAYPVQSIPEGQTVSDPSRVFVVYGVSPLGALPLGNWLLGHTCGDAARLMVIACDGSGSTLRATNSPVDTVSAPAREPAEALSALQSTFGLSITALASVLRVERPTIYSWLQATRIPTSANRERLEKLADLADHWLSLSGGAPLDGLRDEAISGKSLLELLCEEHLRTFAAESAMRELWKRAADRSERRPTLREIARSRGISKDSTEFDALTGRRLGHED